VLIGVLLISQIPIHFPYFRWKYKQNIPDDYLDVIERLHLEVEDTGKDYSYPDRHVKILKIIRPKKGNLMIFIGFEDLDDLDYAQWNDCFLNIEKSGDLFWIEGRMTGAYWKTFYIQFEHRGRVDIARYFDKVWFTIAVNMDDEEIYWGEYWD